MKRKIIAVLIFVLFVLPVPAVLLVPETVQNDFQYRLLSGPEVALSRSYLSDLQSGNFAKIVNNTDPQYRASFTPKLLKKCRACFRQNCSRSGCWGIQTRLQTARPNPT